MEGWEWVLLGVAGFFAVSTLVRLMAQRREELVADMRTQIEEEKERRAAEERRKRRQARRARRRSTSA